MADVETIAELCGGDLILYLNPTYPAQRCMFVKPLQIKRMYIHVLQVLSEGKIVEYDEPHYLLQKEEGIFYEMVAQTGPEEQSNLIQMAEDCHLRKMNSSTPSLVGCTENGIDDIPNGETSNGDVSESKC